MQCMIWNYDLVHKSFMSDELIFCCFISSPMVPISASQLLLLILIQYSNQGSIKSALKGAMAAKVTARVSNILTGVSKSYAVTSRSRQRMTNQISENQHLCGALYVYEWLLILNLLSEYYFEYVLHLCSWVCLICQLFCLPIKMKIVNQSQVCGTSGWSWGIMALNQVGIFLSALNGIDIYDCIKQSLDEHISWRRAQMIGSCNVADMALHQSLTNILCSSLLC